MKPGENAEVLPLLSHLILYDYIYPFDDSFLREKIYPRLVMGQRDRGEKP